MIATGRRRGIGFVGALALLLSLGSTDAFAGQVVVLDETWVHSPDLPDSHYRVSPRDGTPADWVDPVDYSQGKAYVYLEVHSKPTDQPTRFQVCFEATPTYACTAQSPIYTTVGVYEWETNFADFWSPPGEMVDWTQGVNKIACILKDTMNGKPSADNVGPETAALYMPTDVRMVVTLVEPGSVYVPPTPTGESTGGESTGGEDTGGGPSSSGPDTTGEPDTTGAQGTTAVSGTTEATGTTEDPGATATGGLVTTGANPSSSGGTGGGATDGSGDAQGAPAGGCACVVSSSPDVGALALACLLFGLERRRRGAASRRS